LLSALKVLRSQDPAGSSVINLVFVSMSLVALARVGNNNEDPAAPL
jgi:hypothetical protein